MEIYLFLKRKGEKQSWKNVKESLKSLTTYEQSTQIQKTESSESIVTNIHYLIRKMGIKG